MSTPEQIEERVRAALDELGIAGWEWIEIDPQYGDTADFCEQYGYDLPHCGQHDHRSQQARAGGVLCRDRARL